MKLLIVVDCHNDNYSWNRKLNVCLPECLKKCSQLHGKELIKFSSYFLCHRYVVDIMLFLFPNWTPYVHAVVWFDLHMSVDRMNVMLTLNFQFPTMTIISEVKLSTMNPLCWIIVLTSYTYKYLYLCKILWNAWNLTPGPLTGT